MPNAPSDSSVEILPIPGTVQEFENWMKVLKEASEKITFSEAVSLLPATAVYSQGKHFDVAHQATGVDFGLAKSGCTGRGQ